MRSLKYFSLAATLVSAAAFGNSSNLIPLRVENPFYDEETGEASPNLLFKIVSATLDSENSRNCNGMQKTIVSMSNFNQLSINLALTEDNRIPIIKAVAYPGNRTNQQERGFRCQIHFKIAPIRDNVSGEIRSFQLLGDSTIAKNHRVSISAISSYNGLRSEKHSQSVDSLPMRPYTLIIPSPSAQSQCGKAFDAMVDFEFMILGQASRGKKSNIDVTGMESDHRGATIESAIMPSDCDDF